MTPTSLTSATPGALQWRQRLGHAVAILPLTGLDLVCFECPLPDCDTTSRQCPRYIRTHAGRPLPGRRPRVTATPMEVAP